MITFSQFLTEARMGSLYHGVKNYNVLENILRGGIEPRTQQRSNKLLKGKSDKFIRGVSTTRSFKFAMQWSHMNIVLELDHSAISSRYEIKPLQYWDGGGIARYTEVTQSGAPIQNEYEEFIITNKPIPPKYIKRIWIDQRILNKSKFNLPSDENRRQIVNRIRQQYGSDFIRTF